KSAQTEEGEHGTVSTGAETAGNQRQEGLECTGKKRKQGCPHQHCGNSFFLADVPQANDQSTGKSCSHLSRRAFRRLPAIEEKDDAEERDSIEEKCCSRSCCGDHQPSECGTHGPGDVEAGGIQSDSGPEFGDRHQIRSERLPRRFVHKSSCAE